MDNYQFCVEWVLAQPRNEGTRVLDYGCGAGHIVKALRMGSIDAFGCDVFYEGGDYSELIDTELLGNRIRRMDADGNIPFDDESFDYVLSNQVMEHVTDLDKVLSEIHRVLKPGGKVLSLFPDKGVWREGHCGIPFLHWFPKGSRPRVYYAAAFRMMGFGYYKGDKPAMLWSEDFCEWLDKWTWYRPSRDIKRTYGKYFVNENGLEGYWLARRLERLGTLGKLAPGWARSLVVRKLGGRVFVVEKATP